MNSLTFAYYLKKIKYSSFKIKIIKFYQIVSKFDKYFKNKTLKSFSKLTLSQKKTSFKFCFSMH